MPLSDPSDHAAASSARPCRGPLGHADVRPEPNHADVRAKPDHADDRVDVGTGSGLALRLLLGDLGPE